MKIAVMQPTYLPWIGYFDLIDQSDMFVFHDVVQFEKQSWQQRNKIKTQTELRWLTVPVLITGRSSQLIHEVEIVNSAQFPAKHFNMLREHYRRARFFGQYFPELEAIIRAAGLSLSGLNQSIIKWMAGKIGLSPKFKTSSSMKVTGQKSECLVGICKELGATTYLSPLGSAGYIIEEYEMFERNGITVVFQHYEHPQYRQLSEPFLPYASALDLLFNEGERSLEIMRLGQRPHYSLNEARQLVAGDTAEKK